MSQEVKEQKTKKRGSVDASADANLWQQLLEKASRSSLEENTTLIVVGDKQNGKSSLIKKFRNRVGRDTKNKQAISTPYLVDFSYCNVNNVYDENDPEEIRAQLNVWELDSAEAAMSLLPRFLASTQLDRTMYMITLDLSTPWTAMESLERWGKALTEAHNQALSNLPEDEQAKLKERIARFNQFYVDPSVAADDQEAPPNLDEVKVEEGIPPINLGVPVVVVGCKADMLHDVFARQTGVGDRFEYMTRNLRQFCLKYGASLIYSSAMGTNVDVLQDWVYHRLYNFEWRHNAVVVGNENEFAINVPSGYDSEDLIASIQPARASWAEDATFDQVFINPEKKTQRVAQSEQEVKAEDNDVFFKTLKFTQSKSGARESKHAGKDLTARSRSVIQKIKSDKPGKGAGDQRAVKDFFRSLLSEADKGKGKSGADRRKQARDALPSLKKR